SPARQTRRRRHRRGHQSPAGRAPGGRRGLRGGAGRGRVDHPGAGRGRSHDGGHAAAQHLRGGAMDHARILTVDELTRYVKGLLESDPGRRDVWVQGEISNFKHHTSGHMYFTLKDDRAQIRCVMFRSANMRLRFVPENGMEVIARGQVSVYERDGQYQLYVQVMEPRGVGALHVAFEQLKARLEAEGLFDPARKRPLPRLPRRVGIVTSPTGAALRDIIRVARRRFPNITLVVAPVLVQGDEAPPQVIRA